MKCFTSPILMLNGFFTGYVLLLCLIFAPNSPVLSQNITTYAGGLSGLGTALNTNLASPTGISGDANGNLVISDLGNNRIRKINLQLGTIQTVAGNGVFGFAGDGGSALLSNLGFPGGVALDAAGNVYIADQSNNRIRKVDAITGKISTIAGNGDFGFGGDGGPATLAMLANPTSVIVDAEGNILFSDLLNGRIRKIDAQSGNISTVAGSGQNDFLGDGGSALAASLISPFGITLDAAGNLYIADQSDNRIRKVNAQSGIITTVVGTGEFGFVADGQPATQTPVNFPSSVRVDAQGNLYFTDLISHQVRRVNQAGIVQTIAGNGTQGFSGDGLPAIQASLNNPTDIFITSNKVYITDASNNRLRVVDLSNGVIATIAGNGSFIFGGDGDLATAATLRLPAGLAFDSNNNLFFADAENNLIRRVDASTKIISTVAGTGEFGYNGDEIPALTAMLGRPLDVAVDAANHVYFVDQGNNRIRKIDAVTGTISTVVGIGASGFGGDNRAATQATLNGPSSLVIDGQGNLYIADEQNNRIRKVDANTGIITTIAGNGNFGTGGDGGNAKNASLSLPQGLALDKSGNNLYIVTSNLIRKVDLQTGIITRVAGNGVFGSTGDGDQALNAALKSPTDLVLDQFGNIYLAEFAKIRKITASTQIIQTILGNGDPAFNGDGGLALLAQIGSRVNLSLDQNENLFISDTENNRIRKVSFKSEPLIKLSYSETTLNPTETIHFGFVKLNQTNTLEVQIQNTGSSILNLIPPQNGLDFIQLLENFSDNFSLDISATKQSLNPGESTSFKITFSPDSSVNATAKISITSNADNSPTFTFNLLGGGLSPLQIESLVLVDALSGNDIAVIQPDTIINLHNIGAKLLTIRAVTNPAKVGSVFFQMNGPISQSKLENLRPYLLFGENLDKSFIGKVFEAGNYTMQVTPYPSSDRGGNQGEPYVLNFTLEGATLAEITELRLMDAVADTALLTLSDGAVINLDELKVEELAVQAFTNPTEVGSLRMKLEGPINYSRIERLQPYALFGDDSGNDFQGRLFCDGFYTLTVTPYFSEDAQGLSGEEKVIQFQVIRQTQPEAIQVVNVASNQVLFDLRDQHTIDLASTGINLTIQAEIPCVESVKFVLRSKNGQLIHTQVENQAPYFLFGDNKGFPNAWQPQPGDYRLELFSFRGKNAQNQIGNPLNFEFSVVNTGLKVNEISLVTLYPNPVTESVIHLEFSEPLQQTVQLELRDYWGQLKYAGSFEMHNQKELQWVNSGQALPSGVYYIRINTPGMLPLNKMILVK